jgi:NAD dependent epimerase/dehydratase family enzyme
VVAPTPVTNAAFASLLATLVHRPLLPAAPAVAARLLLGELAEEVVLASARVVPTRLLTSGYRFQHATLEEVLRVLLGPETC